MQQPQLTFISIDPSNSDFDKYFNEIIAKDGSRPEKGILRPLRNMI